MVGGVLAAVAAACCYESGYALQALEARAGVVSTPHPSLLVRLARRRRWVAGTALSAAGAGLQLLALSLAPLTVVQPTLALGLLALLAIARLALDERPGMREATGVLAIVAGVTVVGLVAPPHVGRSPAGPALAAELALLAAVALTPYALRSASRVAVAGAAAGDALAALGLKLAADELHRGRVIAAIAWGVLAAARWPDRAGGRDERAPAPTGVAGRAGDRGDAGARAGRDRSGAVGRGLGRHPLGGAVLALAVAVVAAGAVVLASSAESWKRSSTTSAAVGSAANDASGCGQAASARSIAARSSRRSRATSASPRRA